VTSRRSLAATVAVAAAVTLASCAGGATRSAPTAPKLGALERIQADAQKLAPTAESELTRRFLAATATLPHVAPRTLWRDDGKTRFVTAGEYAALPAEQRADLKALTADEELYYNTKYGSPLSYVRALDVLAHHGVALSSGWRVLDFGYGYVGHLRLLASLGLDANGVDVDPLLRALYAEAGDQGDVAGAGGARGAVHLFHGAFPGDPAVVARVGRGYDLVVSKNVLKRGYIHPERPADPKKLIDLGASDDAVLAAFHAALKPGGWFLVYNICPAYTPPDKPYVPWSDGRSPYTKEQWRKAGFEVVAFDVDDTPAVDRMAHLLGWADDREDPWDVDHDLSVLYTLARKPAAAQAPSPGAR
jgi:hypothetical protein